MKIRTIPAGIAMILCMQASAQTDPVDAGKAIFVTRCAACHNVNKTLTGPALAGVEERHSIEWIIDFIRSPQTMIKSGDKDAIAVFNAFNRIPMPDHPDLTAQNIQHILAYIASQASETSTAPFAKPRKKPSRNEPLTLQDDYVFFISYLLSVIILIVVLVFSVHVRTMKGKQDNADLVN